MKDFLINSWWAILIYMVFVALLVKALPCFFELLKSNGIGKDKFVWFVYITIVLLVLFHQRSLKFFFDGTRNKGMQFIVILGALVGAYITVQEMRKDRLLSIQPHLAGPIFNGSSRAGGGVRKDLIVHNVGYGAAIIDSVYWYKPTIGEIESVQKGKAIPIDGEFRFWISTLGKDTLYEPVERNLVIKYNNIGGTQPFKKTIRIRLGAGMLETVE